MSNPARLLAAVATATALALPTPSEAVPPAIRSGTILGGWAPGLAYLGPSPRGCEWTAECAAWLASGCRRELAGRNPGLHDSIVDVRGLGGGTRWWDFRMTRDTVAAGQPTIGLGGLTVQLWTAGCRPLGHVGATKQESIGITDPAQFRIPSSAAWMTVASSDNTTLSWYLSIVPARRAG